MNKLDLQKLKKLFDKDKIASNKKLLVYLFFVVLSTIFWFLNALSKEYTTDINYPVYYTHLPENKVLTNNLPKKLILRVNAYGFDLLRYQLSTAFLSNSFDVEKFTNGHLFKDQISKYTLQSSSIKSVIERDLSDGIRVDKISPDTIVFQFSALVDKKLPVVLKLKADYARQFMQGDAITIEPDSIVVNGPESFIDSLKNVTTQMLVVTDLKKTLENTVSLQKMEGIRFSPKKVKVTIPVQRFTEAQKNIPIKINNLPDSVLLRLFPGDIKLSYFVGMNKYESITEDDFELTVDYNEATKAGINKLAVRLKRSPDFVSNIRMYPQAVSFLIEKRK